MKTNVHSSFSSNRNLRLRGVSAALFALLAAACSSESGEATGSQSEALIYHPLPCLSPAPTLTARAGGPGSGYMTFGGEGFVRYDCRFALGQDSVSVTITPLDANGNMLDPTQTVNVTSGEVVIDAGVLPVGEIYGSFLMSRFEDGCTAKSFLLNAYDNTTNTLANNGNGLIVASPGCS